MNLSDSENDNTFLHFAAYGKIKAEIKKLYAPNNEEIELPEGALSRGRVKGRPPEEAFATIPVDRGEGRGKKGNKIADSGWIAGNAFIDDAATGSPAGDIDNDPPYSPEGDGLVTLEEYRGFKVRGELRRTNPFRKDVFAYSDLPVGIAYFRPALPASVHRINKSEYLGDSAHDVNWKNRGIAGHIRQCAVVFKKKSKYQGSDHPFYWGDVMPDVPGSPCTIRETSIYYDQIFLDVARYGGNAHEIMKYTIGHEGGHNVSFPDRGCSCNDLSTLSMMCLSCNYPPFCTRGIGPAGCVFSATPKIYREADLENMRLK